MKLDDLTDEELQAVIASAEFKLECSEEEFVRLNLMELDILLKEEERREHNNLMATKTL